MYLNNESGKDDENNTYIEILKEMNEKQRGCNNFKKIKKLKNNNKENRKQITPPSIPIKKEIIPKILLNKREITPENYQNKMTNKGKKIPPVKKIPLKIDLTNKNFDSKFGLNKNCGNNIIMKKKVIKKCSKNETSIGHTNKLTSKMEKNCYNQVPFNQKTYQNLKKKRKIKNSDSSSNSPSPPSTNLSKNHKDKNKSIKDSNNIINNTNYTLNENKGSNSNINNSNNYVYINNSKKVPRNSGRNKFIYFKKERLSGSSFNKANSKNDGIDLETRNKSNDQKYNIYNSKCVLNATKKRQK